MRPHACTKLQPRRDAKPCALADSTAIIQCTAWFSETHSVLVGEWLVVVDVVVVVVVVVVGRRLLLVACCLFVACCFAVVFLDAF